MKYSKEEIIKYSNLDDILKLDLPKDLLNEVKDKFNKRVYFEYDDSCKFGILCGLEINWKDSTYFYVLETNNKRIILPCSNSITLI